MIFTEKVQKIYMDISMSYRKNIFLVTLKSETPSRDLQSPIPSFSQRYPMSSEINFVSFLLEEVIKRIFLPVDL